MTRRIMHVDMDAFFASVEALDRPELRGKPVIVGGKSARSVVCACSYETRKFGVRSAMPMAHALERCPSAIVLPPRFHRYREISDGIFQRFRAVTPLVEETSIDEGYLDIGEIATTDQAAWKLGDLIKKDIWDNFTLKCSVGIAPCKFAAKIASDLKKPDALVLVRETELDAFLEPLDVDRIPGVGKEGRKTLLAANVRTIADLRRVDVETLTAWFGKWGARLHDFALGIDPRPVVTEHERKSLGAENTFERDVRDWGTLLAQLNAQARRLARELEESGFTASTITVKVRYADFETVTRRRTFSSEICNAGAIARVAHELLELTDARRRAIRLVGISLSGLRPQSGQLELPLFSAEPFAPDE